mgnify:CR=1 FL=1
MNAEVMTEGNRLWALVPGKRKKLLLSLAFLFVFVLITMWLNSIKPPLIETVPYERDVKGSAFVNANLLLVDQMMRNWLPNDKFWPTVMLDNMPNFQLGQLELVRYNIRGLRDRLSRMRSTDKLDPFAEKAFSALANDPKKWWFPSAESKWKEAHKYLTAYQEGLRSGTSNFFPRADNLAELFQDISSLLGGANTRLLNSTREKKVVKEIEDISEGSTSQQTEVELDVPWYKVDDNFYYSQGIAYALYPTLLAVKLDFREVLIKKNCMGLLDSILEDLRRCYFEPLIVFNGEIDSIFANHSLNLASVLADAKQKMDSIVVTLTRG